MTKISNQYSLTNILTADLANSRLGIGLSNPSTTLDVVGTGTFSVNVNTGGTNIVHTIGESYGGGIVFYVYDGGKHGLIAATSDQSTGVIWNNGSSVDCNAVRNGINGGMSNTERIIIKQGGGTYAAQVCANFGGSSYGDWYLPSPIELNFLYLQRAAVGGFTTNTYWSSREPGDTGATAQNFSNGVQSSFNKGNTFYVRAIRAF